MAAFTLSDNHSLHIEPADKKLRLIITDGQQELACRMETSTAIKSFLASAEIQLFKGRLQLHKRNEAVVVVLKGEDIGVVAVKALLEGLPAS